MTREGTIPAAKARTVTEHGLYRAPLAITLVFLVLCALGGGASRADVASLLYLNPGALLCLAALLVLPIPRDFHPVRIPLILLAAFALLMLIQIIPLPPGMWTALPGHERYEGAAAIMGVSQPWRPISLSPDLTLQSLTGLIFPLVALVAYASLPHEHRLMLLPILIGFALTSAVFGVVQVMSGSGPAFLYDVTHEGSAVGFFANRNHQAALLAMAYPMLAIWTSMPHPDRSFRRVRLWVAGAIGLFLVPLLLITGSRAGLVLAVLSLVAAYFLRDTKLQQGRTSERLEKANRAFKWLFFIVPAVLVGLVILLGRDEAVRRFISPEYLFTEARISYLPLTTSIAWDFFPFGAGFGTFDPVFRGYEPHDRLSIQYFNHAHNDLIELAITGGLPALILLAVLVFFIAATAWSAFRARATHRTDLCARLGAVMILLLFIASLVDYPLRTPLMSAIFALACAWLFEARSRPAVAARAPQE